MVEKQTFNILLLVSTVLLIYTTDGAPQRTSSRTKSQRSREICQLELDVGTCNERQRRFYYDPLTNQCLAFMFTGCGGNANKFRTASICERRCKDNNWQPPIASAETPTPSSTGCPPNQCFMDCGFAGFARDEDGCEICQCQQSEVFEPSKPDLCPPVCRMYCPHGFVRDANGCELCECVEPPLPPSNGDGCSLRPTCSMYCEHGFQKDADECDICNCAQPPECGWQPFCFTNCPTGFKKGDDGCYICECEDDVSQDVECSDIQCRMYCENGFQRDENGCEICRCNEPEDECALRPMCAMYCEHGFEKDSDGCDLCRCVEPPNNCALKPTCQMYCEHGFQKDADGCDLCNCAQPPECNLRPMCRMFCPTGFKTGSDGCYVCQCADQPVQISYDKCSGKPRCRKYCEQGYKKDQDGCDSCECNDVGCRPVQCFMHCEHGLRKDERGCDVCECVELPAGVDAVVAEQRKNTVCLLTAEVGRCRAKLTRWHYNSIEKRCDSFSYGGCRGNANNFRSENACKKYCLPEINHARVEKRKMLRRRLSLQ